jgi:chromosome segregation ATPase
VPPTARSTTPQSVHDQEKAEPPSTPYSEILRSRLNDEQAELDKRTKGNAALKADLAAAEKAEKEVDQALAAYEQALSNLTKEKRVADQYVSAKLSNAEDAVGKNKETIKKIVIEDDAGTKSLEKKVSGLIQDFAQAETDYFQATKHLAGAKDSFDKMKVYAADQTANRVTIKELIVKSDKEEPGHPANIYFLINEIKTLNTDLKSSRDFGKELRQALRNLNDATDTLREKKLSFEAKGIDLDKHQKALSERQAKRMDRILKAISKYNDNRSSNEPA